jgi:cation transport regulator ChaC
METVVYFAYGSNMLSRRLQERTPSATAIGIGFVEGRRLAFHKVSKDGSGKCDIESTGTQSDRAFGVLFSVASAEKRDLDRAEGLGNGYKEENITVHRSDGTTVDAITYVATAIEPALRPYDWYKALVVAGAIEHSLPPAYVEWIRTFHSQPDPNVERRAKNERLLFSS